MIPSFTVGKSALRYNVGNKRVVGNGGPVGSNTNISVPSSGITHFTVGSTP